VNSLPKTVTRQRRGCDLNPGPSAPESSALTTRLPGHPFKSVTYWVPDSTTRTQTRTQTRTTPDKVHRLVGDSRRPNGLCRRLRQSGRGPAWLNLDTTMFVTRGFDGFGRNRPPPWRRTGSLKFLKEKLMPVSNHQNFYRLQFR